MKLNMLKLTGLYLAVMVLFSACGSLKADMEPDWQSRATVSELGYVQVLNNGERVMLGTERDVYLIDGNSGESVADFRESFWQKFERSVEVGIDTRSRSRSMLLGDAMSDSYDLLPLPHSGVVLLLDYRYTTENITAIDAETGKELWDNSSFDYSLAKYSGLIEGAARRIGRGLASAIGGEHEEESKEERRERQVNFMQRLAYDLPGEDRFFFKTFDGLLLVDSKSGDIIAQIDDFSGSGLAGAKRLENGDYVVVSGGQSISNLSLSGGYHLARLNSDGEVIWMAEHNGRRTNGLMISGDVVLVDGGPTEAFSLEDGSKLWENNVRRYYENRHFMIIDNDIVYIASDLEGRIGQVESSKVWAQDLHTGDTLWETEETMTIFTGMEMFDDRLMVFGSGRLFEGRRGGVAVYNKADGSELWKSPEMTGWGVQFSGIFGFMVSRPLVEGDRVYVADPEELFVLNFETGELIYKVSHEDHDTGVLLGKTIHGDNVIIAGRDAVVAFNKEDGSRAWKTEIDRSDRVAFHGDKMVFSNGQEIALVVDMASGQRSPVMRHKSDKRYFGSLDNTVFVDGDATFVISIDENGRVYRHSF